MSPEPTATGARQGERGKSMLWVLLISTLVAAALAVGAYLYVFNTDDTELDGPAPSTETVDETPAATAPAAVETAPAITTTAEPETTAPADTTAAPAATTEPATTTAPATTTTEPATPAPAAGTEAETETTPANN